MLNTQTTFVYIDEPNPTPPNPTWRIAARTLPTILLASCRQMYFFLALFFFLAPQTTPQQSKHTCDSSMFHAPHQKR
jgi:hypothetical protein